MNSKEIRSVIDSLRVMITDIVNEKINQLPVTLPCKVLSRGKVTVSVVPILSFHALTPPRIDDVPILKSKYINEPVQTGDFGFLLPSSFFYQEVVTKDKATIETAVATVSMGNYLFLPLSQVGSDFSSGLETELWDKTGTVHLRVKNNQIELNGSSGYATEHTALNTGLQTFLLALNTALGSKLDGVGTPGTLTLDISSAKVEDVRV